MAIIKKYGLYLIGGVLGGIGGYLYWLYVGCSTGTCVITSSPVLSVIWGGLFGGLLFSLFTKKGESGNNVSEK